MFAPSGGKDAAQSKRIRADQSGVALLETPPPFEEGFENFASEILRTETLLNSFLTGSFLQPLITYSLPQTHSYKYQ